MTTRPEYRIEWTEYPTHLRGTLYRRTELGALEHVGTQRVSYVTALKAISRAEGTPGVEELGWVGNVEEIGALGKRVKKFAKKVAKSKFAGVVKGLSKAALSVVPGGGAALTGVAAARGVARAIKPLRKVSAAPAPAVASRTVALRRAPQPVYQEAVYETEAEADPDLEATDIELGATTKRAPVKKPAAKAPPKKAPAKKPAAKPAARPAAAKKAPAKKAAPVKAKPTAKPAARPAAAKKAPAKKAAPVKAKPAAKRPAAKPPAKKQAVRPPAAKATPSVPPRPANAAIRAKAIAADGGASASLLKAASVAETPEQAQTVARLATLASEIEDSAPELAATLATLPDVPAEERDLVETRAVEAARVLADTPKEERAELAQRMEQRLDAYKVTTPEGDTIYIPFDEVG